MNIPISVKLFNRIVIQREVAVSICGALVIALCIVGLLLQMERVKVHKLRTHLAAACSVTDVPPKYWQPEWSNERGEK